jgi:anti-sigma factor RsiW
MDREREIIHKILDNEADENDRNYLDRAAEENPAVNEEFTGLMNAVRMLEEGERREPPQAFTGEVMNRIPRARTSVLDRIRDFLFGSRVLRWNMATALATAVIVIAALALVSRTPRELPVQLAETAGQTVTVRLSFYSPQAQSVAVAGDFNKWKTDVDRMQRIDGMWNIELKLQPGVYTYSFIVNGTTWVPDPGAGSYQDDGFGSRNAVMRVNI